MLSRESFLGTYGRTTVAASEASDQRISYGLPPTGTTSELGAPRPRGALFCVPEVA